VNVPAKIKKEIKDWLWAEADQLNWSSLSAADKSRYYAIWTETKDVGGRLGLYMDPRQVRVYIKDTLLKPYTREIASNPEQAFRVLGLPSDTRTTATYIKPHGRQLADGRQVAWSKASEWKATLMALHERAFETGWPYAAVLTEAGAKFAMPGDRSVAESAAKKLGIEKIVWID
jgi:hypothetical protein